jgi:leucyl aminopeptidase
MAIPVFSVEESYVPREGDSILLPYRDGGTPCFKVDALPGALQGVARAPKEEGGGIAVFLGEAEGVRLSVRCVRLDTKRSSVEAEARKLVVKGLGAAKKQEAARVVVLLDGQDARLAVAVQEGALLGGYAFDRYLEKKAEPLPVLLVVSGGDTASLRKRLEEEAAVCGCVNFARDVLNEPPNVIKPPSLAEAFILAGKESGLDIHVWDENKLAEERCGGILGVGQGSAAKPRLVIGEYNPEGAQKHLCLVGKGITFDSGGYCLKPTEGQIGMKYDMGGAAMCFAAACAIARLKLPLRVTVLTPLAENAISGEAYMNTSILTTRSGKTIEVHSTDAEGRLLLADALVLASERKPDWIVDAATLTGACVVGLGEDIAGALGTDTDFTQALVKAGVDVGEWFWELPLHLPYIECMKTTVADVKNSAGHRWGGAITAAVFLKEWVPDGQKWIHCDIAGPGCKEEPLGHLGKGAKGFGVKTLVRLARELAGK